MDPKNIRLIVAYDGTRYHGWQRQANALTLQEVLEDRLQIMTGTPHRIIASGRTDAGVHALNQVCHFLTPSTIPLPSLKKGLNALLPDDILVKQAEEAPIHFHSRYSVKSKVYEYRIWNSESPDLFRRHFQWHIRPPLDVEVMQTCLSGLVGMHDFSSFRSAGSGNLDPVRTVLKSEIHVLGKGSLCIVIEADGFLRHMVRNIVGTVVAAGLGNISPRRFEEIFVSKDRGLAGVKAPPQGLFLVEVKY